MSITKDNNANTKNKSNVFWTDYSLPYEPRRVEPYVVPKECLPKAEKRSYIYEEEEDQEEMQYKSEIFDTRGSEEAKIRLKDKKSTTNATLRNEAIHFSLSARTTDECLRTAYFYQDILKREPKQKTLINEKTRIRVNNILSRGYKSKI